MNYLLLLAAFILAPVDIASGAAADIGAADPVIGLILRGAQKAYPLALFKKTPVVNDQLGRLAIVVFYDQGSDYSAAFFRLVAGEPVEFSGQAAGKVADDLTTATRWDMTTGQGVSGNLVGMRLVPIPARRMAFAEWLSTYPQTAVYQP